MGLNFLKSHDVAVANPNPRKFTVLRSEAVGKLWVSEIKYHGCTNFEGRKVLVTDFSPIKVDVLDPHFQVGGGVIARFAPTNEGWVLARMFTKFAAMRAEIGDDGS